MGFNLGKMFRTVFNPLVGKATPAQQSRIYAQQGRQMAMDAATNYNNQVAMQQAQAAMTQQPTQPTTQQAQAVQQQQATQAQTQADTLAAADDGLRQAALMAQKGSTANTLYGGRYKTNDETTSRVLLGG